VVRCARRSITNIEVIDMATTKDIAKALEIDEQTVRRYAREGIIPFSETLGGHRRYDLNQVRVALMRARSRKLEPIHPSSEEVARLSVETEAAPLRLARSRRRGISRAMIAEAGAEAARIERAPFIGVAGSSRFVVGDGASARR
jgi:DNA-binding transcriptional MerR regulator